MIDKKKLQRAIYKYEYLIKNEDTYKNGIFAEKVFKDALGIEEDKVNEIKQNYCRKNNKYFKSHLQKPELTKKYLYILQVLPFEGKIHYYLYDLQKILDYAKDNMVLYFAQQHYVTIYFDDSYKYTSFPNDCLIEYLDDLSYDNPENKEIFYLENIQKNLLKKENLSFEDMSVGSKEVDIKINNIKVGLKATKNIQRKNNTYFWLYFTHTVLKTEDYFILSYIFKNNQNMINIIIKNNNYNVEQFEIMIPKSFVNIINDTSLSDKEKIEKLKDIPISYKGIPLKFYTTKEVFEFFNSL